MGESAIDGKKELTRKLGLFSATTIVVGSMIGSGVFIVAAEIGRRVDSPALFIAAWLVTVVMTLSGALSYGELAAMMPWAGGQYVYLREAMGGMVGFLYGWTLFLVIQTGIIAAVCVAFGKFLGVFFPAVSSTHWLLHLGTVPAWHVHGITLGNMEIGLNTANLAGIIVVVLLTAINMAGVRMGALIQSVFTVAKSAAVVALIVAGFAYGRNAVAMAANFGPGWSAFWHNARGLHPLEAGMGGPTVMVGMFTVLAVVQVGSLFSADAWNTVTFTAGEVKDPQRNMPLSLAVGVGFVLLLYILANFAYLCVLPLHGSPDATTVLGRGIQYAGEDRVGTAVLQQTFGARGGWMMAGAILISTFGCANGMVMGGARVFYAMSRDGLFFKSVGKLSGAQGTPRVAMLIQCVWTCVLCISGSYGQLLDYTIFAELIFYILTIASLFVLRARKPDAVRPYRAIGYPVLPALYIVMAGWICLCLLRYKPQYTWPGLILVLTGIPVYLFWTRMGGVPEGAQAIE